MPTSIESIFQGLSSVLAVAVLALLPAACEKTDAKVDGEGAPRAAVIEADRPPSDLHSTGARVAPGSSERGVRGCSQPEIKEPPSCSINSPEPQGGSRSEGAADSPGERELSAPDQRARREPDPAARPDS